MLCVGKVDDDSSADAGYVAEIKLPKSATGLSLSSGVRVTAALENKDERKEYVDSIEGHTMIDLSSWTYVSIK